MSRHRLLRLRTPRIATLVGCVVVAAVAALSPSSALAASGPYSIDGVVPDSGSPAPTQLTDDHGSVKELGPINASGTKIGVIQNAATPMLGFTNPNAQVDLVNAWLQMKRQGSDDWLYFAWQRDSNSGSGFIAFEFMKSGAPAACDYTRTAAQLQASCNPWKNRQAGDFLILWDQSGSNTTLYKRVWSGTAGNLTLGAPQALTASVSEAKFSPDGFRGEAAIDLTQAIQGGTASCLTLANVVPSTVTGNSDSADYKDTILKNIPPLSNCSASITTTPADSTGATLSGSTVGIGTGVVAVKDHAVVGVTGGSPTPSGSVDFSLCKVDSPGVCSPTTASTSVGSTALTGTSFPVAVNSPTAYVTSVGRYCWRASWAGDTANGIPAVTENPSTECFTVTPATPSLSTTAVSDAVLGGTVSDSAELTGAATDPASPVINLTGTAGPAAGGTITFKLYGPSSGSCGSLDHTTSAVTVSGNDSYGTPAPQYAPGSAGDYHWVATYSGSTNNSGLTHNVLCDDTSEDVTVTSAAVSLDTEQSWVPNDSASLSAAVGGDLSGTVTFTLYPSTGCTGTPVFAAEQVPVSGSSPQSVSTTNTTAVPAGSYSWKVAYSSDNPAQRSIPGSVSCQETSSLTVANGSTVTSP